MYREEESPVARSRRAAVYCSAYCSEKLNATRRAALVTTDGWAFIPKDNPNKLESAECYSGGNEAYRY